MRIERNELIKLFTRKSVLLAIAVIILLNAGLIINNIYGETDRIFDIPAKAYKQVYADISGKSNDEALSFINQKLENCHTNATTNRKLLYTGNEETERILLTESADSIQQCKSYDKYLESIDLNAEMSGKIIAFSNSDEFSYRNIAKTKLDFVHLKGIKLSQGPSKGITSSTEFIGTDILGILLIIFIVTTLLTRERELSQLQLVKSTYKGRLRLALSKLFVIFVSCFAVEALLYATNILISNSSYGFGDLSRPIQSVTGYLSCNLKLSVFEYLVVFLLSKLLIYFVIASFVYMIAVVSRNALKLYIIVGCVLGLSAICYYSIEPTSWLSLLKYINIIGFLNTFQIYNKYLNLNVFSHPVFYVVVFIIVSIVMLLIFSYLAVVIFSEQKEISNSSNKISLRFKFLKSYKTTKILPHECYKTFISGKVLLILILFGLTIFFTYKPIQQDFQTSDGYYKAYMQILEGPVTQEKLDYIRQERERFNKIHEDMNKSFSEASDNRDSQELSNMYENLLRPENSFINVENHTKYLQEKKGNYLFDDGYKLLTGDECAHNKDVKLAIIALLMTICCVTYIYSVEYQNKANVLLRCSYNGRLKTFVSKFFIALIVVTIIYFLTYAPYFYNVLSKYGTSSIIAPACSMEHLNRIPGSISILEYLIAISVMRFLGMIISIFLIFVISIKAKSYISSILINTAVLIIPLLIYFAGVSVFKYVLLNPLLLGNIF